MSCPHASKRKDESTQHHNKVVWDDVGNRWVQLRYKTVTRKTICNDCESVLETQETTSEE
jgi:hypothetical protein